MFKFNFDPDGGKDFEEDPVDNFRIREDEPESISPLKQHDFALCLPTNSDIIDSDICQFDELKYFVDRNTERDLQNGHFEGGNVVWECTLDLLQHLKKGKFQIEGKSGNS